MMADARFKPTDVELQVLSGLVAERAEHGPAGAGGDAGPQGAGLHYGPHRHAGDGEKGLLTHTRQGMAHIYKPAVTRRQVLRPMMRGLVERVFGEHLCGSQQLLSETDVTAEELAKIREMLREHDWGRQDT